MGTVFKGVFSTFQFARPGPSARRRRRRRRRRTERSGPSPPAAAAETDPQDSLLPPLARTHTLIVGPKSQRLRQRRESRRPLPPSCRPCEKEKEQKKAGIISTRGGRNFSPGRPPLSSSPTVSIKERAALSCP